MLVFCPPRLADTVRATPMTTWRVCLSREDRRKHQEKPEDISKPSCHRVASGIRRLNTSSVSQDTRNPTGGGYGKVDASVLYDKCQPMWGGNCIPQVVGAGASGSTGRLLDGISKVYIADSTIDVVRDERGGWQCSSKMCPDRVPRPDPCSDGLN